MNNVMSELSKNYPGTGDIRLRIEMANANRSFRLFYQIKTEEGGYIIVDWGDGSVEILTGKTTYLPEHTYTTAGEYIVKLTGSKFIGVHGFPTFDSIFQVTVKEILSLKMPTDSTNVSLRYAFNGCCLTGNIPAWDDCIVNAYSTYRGCAGLTGNIPKWGPNILDAGYTYHNCSGLTGNIPEWGSKITKADSTYYDCTGLTGNIPKWSPNITKADNTYYGCTGLTGNIPEWGEKITSAYATYMACSSLTGNIPEWGANITNAAGTYQCCTGLTGNIPKWGPKIVYAGFTYSRCSGLTGNIPAWGANIDDVGCTYYYCTGLTDCSKELLQDLMPSRITFHNNCVYGCARAVRQHFTKDWGGIKAS